MGFSSQQGVFIAKTQTARGTLATNLGTTGIGFYRTGGSMASNVELMNLDAEIGGNRDRKTPLLGPTSYSGDIDFYCRFNQIGLLLKAALGAPTSATKSGTTAGVYEHSYVPTDAVALPFLTVYERIGASLERISYQDCVVNTLHLESAGGEYVTGTVGLIGCRATYGVTDIDPSAVMDETTTTVGSNVTVLYDGVDLAAKSFSLDIANNFEDDDFRLGSRYLADLVPKSREVGGSVTLRPENYNLMRQAVLGSPTATVPGGLVTSKALNINIGTFGEIPTSAPSTNYSLNMEFLQTILEPFNFEPSGDDVIENDVNFQAVRPKTVNNVMTAKLVNGLTVIP